MEDILLAYEKVLPDLLKDESIWSSLCINYHPPFVDRLFTKIGNNRLNLHKIYCCELHQPLMHPHPWPSAIKIISGKYEMEVGFSSTVNAPKDTMKMILTEGSIYEMTNINAWHSVRPLEAPSLSLMVTGVPNGRVIKTKPQDKLKPLRDESFHSLINEFRNRYG